MSTRSISPTSAASCDSSDSELAATTSRKRKEISQSSNRMMESRSKIHSEVPNGHAGSFSMLASAASLLALGKSSSSDNDDDVKPQAFKPNKVPSSHIMQEDTTPGLSVCEEPGPLDVVCGRGRGYFNQPGNRRMLIIVEKNKGRYRAAGKTRKTEIAKEVTEEIQAGGTRFLKRSGNIWKDVTALEAHKKVCHCLREEKGNQDDSVEGVASGDDSSSEVQSLSKDDNSDSILPSKSTMKPKKRQKILQQVQMKPRDDFAHTTEDEEISLKDKETDEKIQDIEQGDNEDSSTSDEESTEQAMKRSALVEVGNMDIRLPRNLAGLPATSRELEIQRELELLRNSAFGHSLGNLGIPARAALVPPGSLPGSILQGDAGRLGLRTSAGAASSERPTANGVEASLDLGKYGLIMGDPTPEDILCGIDPTLELHPGNIRLRAMIQASVGYHPATTEQKLMISKGILARLTISGARFLSRQRVGVRDFWYQLTDVEAEVLIFRCLCEEEHALHSVVHGPALLSQLPNHPIPGFDPYRSTGFSASNNLSFAYGARTVGDLNHAAVSATSRQQSTEDEIKPAQVLSGVRTNSYNQENKKERNLDQRNMYTTACTQDGANDRKNGHDNQDSAIETDKETTVAVGISGPGPHDIVCGRGRGNFRHRGNLRLLQIFQETKGRYTKATKKEKTNIAKDIVKGIKERGGRFLKRRDDGTWSVVSEKDSLRKVCHGIRDMHTARDGSKRKPMDYDELLRELENDNEKAQVNENQTALEQYEDAEGQEPEFAPQKETTTRANAFPAEEKMPDHPTTNKAVVHSMPIAPKLGSKEDLTKPEAKNGSHLIVPGVLDVVCGRGRGHFSHSGNRRMLRMINECKERYKAATKVGKGLIAREILHNIQEQGGRFLKRKEQNPSQWELVEYKEALKKVCHGIRDCICSNEAKGVKKETKKPKKSKTVQNQTLEVESTADMLDSPKRANAEGESCSSIEVSQTSKTESSSNGKKDGSAERSTSNYSGNPDSYRQGSLQGSQLTATGLPMQMLMAARQATGLPGLTAEEAVRLHKEGQGTNCVIS